MIVEIPQPITGGISMKRKILYDHAAPCAGAAYQDAQGPHAPRKLTALHAGRGFFTSGANSGPLAARPPVICLVGQALTEGYDR
jgi:hypothetical protein